MSNKIMIDSSLLIEFAKGVKKNLLLSLIHNLNSECYINETIVSEYLYYFLILNSNSSPQSLKSSKKINKVFKIHSITHLASHDKDFEKPCKAEEIELLREE